MSNNNENTHVLSDEEIRKLVVARLSVLSADTQISIGQEGNFTRDELIKSVEQGDKIGEKIAEIQMEWLREMKKGLLE